MKSIQAIPETGHTKTSSEMNDNILTIWYKKRLRHLEQKNIQKSKSSPEVKTLQDKSSVSFDPAKTTGLLRALYPTKSTGLTGPNPSAKTRSPPFKPPVQRMPLMDFERDLGSYKNRGRQQSPQHKEMESL